MKAPSRANIWKMKVRPSQIFTLLLLIAGAMLPALGASQGSDTEEIRKQYELSPGATVSVTNPSGRITISGWRESYAEVHVVKRANRHPEDLSLVQIDISNSPARLEIRTIFERNRNVRVDVEIDIKAPMSVSIDAARSNSGDISITGVDGHVVAETKSGNLGVTHVGDYARLGSTSGDLEIASIKGRLDASSTSGNVSARDTGAAVMNATSGDVTLTNAGGNSEARSSSGDITMERVRGDALASSSSGNVKAFDVTGNARLKSMSGEVSGERISGSIAASSISGGVRLTGGTESIEAHSTSDDVVIRGAKGRIDAGSVSGNVRMYNIESGEVDASSTSGDIEYNGSLNDGGSYNFESLSGNVKIVIPSQNCGFNLSASTYSGEIDTDFEIKVTGLRSGGNSRRLEGVSGNGCARLKAKSFSGNVTIRGADSTREQQRKKR